jgi:hypothetical protein
MKLFLQLFSQPPTPTSLSLEKLNIAVMVVKYLIVTLIANRCNKRNVLGSDMSQLPSFAPVRIMVSGAAVTIVIGKLADMYGAKKCSFWCLFVIL